MPGDDPTAPPEKPHASDTKPLPSDVQEHLGRRLRSTYTVEAAKPAFLGDTALPPQFERYVRQLENAERSSREGLKAVGDALGVKPEGEAEA